MILIVNTPARPHLSKRMPIPAQGIASHILLDGIPLAAAGEVRSRTFEPQSGIFYEGHPGTSAYRIISGEVSIVRQIAGQSKYQPLARLGPDRYFGELAYLGSNRRNATAFAVTRTLVLEMDAQSFELELLTIEEGYRPILWQLLEFIQSVPPRSVWPGGKLPVSLSPQVSKIAGTISALHPEMIRIPGAFMRALYAHLIDASLERFPDS